jgi:RsiW-degrading membrane proteinase PrsW (M82 family)
VVPGKPEEMTGRGLGYRLRFYQRAWFRVWVGMVGIAVLLAVVNQTTGNIAVIPAALFYAAAAGPVAFALATEVRTRFALTVAPGTLLGMFLFGGGIALVVGSFLDALFTDGAVGIWPVGFIEELAKFLPVLVVALTGRYLTQRAGVALGFASAMGFAILETMFYGFDELGRGGIVWAEVTEVGRGITTPFAHLAWTGLLCAVAFGIWQHRGRVAITPTIIGAYLLVAVLHSANDAMELYEPAIGLIALVFAVLIAFASYVLFRLSTRRLTLGPDEQPPEGAGRHRADIPDPRSAESDEPARREGTTTGGGTAEPPGR